MTKKRDEQLETPSSSQPTTDRRVEEPADPPPGEEPKRKRAVNPEIQAMAAVDRIMSELDDETATRVLSWYISKHNDAMQKKYETECQHHRPPGGRVSRMTPEQAGDFLRHMMGGCDKPADAPASGGDFQGKSAAEQHDATFGA